MWPCDFHLCSPTRLHEAHLPHIGAEHQGTVSQGLQWWFFFWLRNVRQSPHTSASSQPQTRKWLVTCGLLLCTRDFYDWWNAQKTKKTGHVGSLPGWRRRTLMSGFPSRIPSRRDTWTIHSSAFRSSGSTAEGAAHQTFHCGRRKWLLILN